MPYIGKAPNQGVRTRFIYQAGGTQQTDIVGYSGDPVTHFSGYLLG